MDITKIFAEKSKFHGFNTDIVVGAERSISIIMDLYQENFGKNKRFQSLKGNKFVISGVSHGVYDCIGENDSRTLRGLLNSSRPDWNNLKETDGPNYPKLAFTASIEPKDLLRQTA
jgi:hypothetical protein